jgi:hypothetical protein
LEKAMKGILLALTIMVLGCGVSFAGEPSDKPAFDNTAPADESAKMGKDEETHTGEHGSKPENDTKKVEQPERKNIPSNDTQPQ